MDSSFTPIEQMLKFRASRHEDFPYQEILLTRLCMHMQSKLLENRNKMLKAQGINETLFMALITLESQENHSIQPSELSCALGSSRTNATRIADELEIINIAVHPDARQQGLGGCLLDYALREETKLGILAMFLEVRTSNTPAIRLYERAGFRLAGRRRSYYTAPVEDGLVYEKRL